MNSTKKLIIKTADELFKERGYDNVSVNDICQACSITKTTFYYHLKSKEDTIVGYYDPVTENLTSQLAEILMAENHWEQLMTLFETLAAESGEFGAALDSQVMIINLKEDRGTYDFRDNLTKIAVAIIERAQNAGQIRNQSPAEPLYKAAAHAYMGYQFKWCVKKGEFERKSVLRQAMENIFDVAQEYRKTEI